MLAGQVHVGLAVSNEGKAFNQLMSTELSQVQGIVVSKTMVIVTLASWIGTVLVNIGMPVVASVIGLAQSTFDKHVSQLPSSLGCADC